MNQNNIMAAKDVKYFIITGHRTKRICVGRLKMS